MTAYRFRVKFDPDPTSLWRDIVVGSERPLTEFQATINSAVGLDDSHLWFIGADEAYWNSDIKYQCPQNYEESLETNLAMGQDRIENAGQTTAGELVRQVGLERYDRICYLYDYGDEWRFYAILKEIISEDSADKAPTVVGEKGDTVSQYDRSGMGGNDPSLPEPLCSMLPETAVPVADLRGLEEHEDVVHMVILLSIEAEQGRQCKRFLVQLERAGYLVENFNPGWQVVKQIDGENKSEEELLADLAAAARDWHAEIAELSGAVTGQQFDAETVEAMHLELEAELERKGYGHL